MRFLFLGLMLAMVAFPANAEISINTISPGNFASLDNAIFSFNATSTTATTCSIVINGTARNSTSATANAISSIITPLLESAYTWSLNCTDSSSTNSTSQFVIIIDTNKPTVELTGPDNRTKTKNTTINFTYNANDGWLSNCSLFTNATGQFAINQSKPGTQKSFWATFGDGSYLFSIRCNDSIFDSWSQNHSLTVDSTPPAILSQNPTTTAKQNLPLNVTTGENASCSYSQSSGTNHSSMTRMEPSTGIIHTVILSGLSDGIHTYYVRCNDNLGNFNTEDFIATLGVQLPPTAEITLNDPSPLRPGVIEITVLTSRAMASAPSLSYSMSDAPSSIKTIPLSSSSSSTNWKGFIITDDTGQKKIGTFYFSGTDTRGIAGTEINSGKYFIVDGEKPGAPESIKAMLDGQGNIKLSWYYDDEDVQTFNIYRSTLPNVDFTDFYNSINASSYTDNSTSDKTTYYYKINVVDMAGNKGPLSAEVYSTAVKKDGTSASNEPKLLPPNLVLKVNSAVNEIDSVAVDFHEASLGMKAKSSREEILAISLLGLVAFAEDAKSKLEQISKELSDVKKNYATEAEIDNKIRAAEAEIELIRKKTVADLKVLDSSKTISVASQDDVFVSVDLVLKDLTKEKRESYSKSAYQKLGDIKIESETIAASLEFGDGTKTDKTIVRKSASHNIPEKLNDLIVVEIIPKEMANQASEIEFLTTDYEILKDDPIIKFGILELGAEPKHIDYVINKKVSAESSKSSKTVVLANLDSIEKKNQNKLAGFAVISGISEQAGLGKGGMVFVILGLASIVVLLLYYKAYPSEEPRPKGKIRGHEDYSAIVAMISDARTLIRDGKNREAQVLYPHIQTLYRQLPEKIREKVYDECVNLHNTITKSK